jgi:hypothetical protein
VELAVCRDDAAPATRDGRAITEDAVISVVFDATRISDLARRKVDR